MSLADRDLVEEERARQRLRDEALARDIVPPAGMDDGTKRMALVAGGLGALLVVVVGGWSLLGHHHAAAGIPVIDPPPGPVRVKPVDPGGMQLMSAQVAQTNGPGAQALAPGPEAADPQLLQQQVDAARHAAAPPPRPAPVATTPRPATPTPTPTRATIPQATVPPAAATPATAPPATTTPATATPPDAPPKEPAATTPATPDDTPDATPDTRPAPAPAAAPTPATGGHAVQLGALDSDALARTEWARLSRKAPALFAGRAPVVSRATHGSLVFFRLRTGGFASAAEASAFCGRVRAEGIVCTVATF